MAALEQQEEEETDSCIIWETPDSPASADDYIFVLGKRMVRPYYFEFVAHVKKRWSGKFIVDVFSQEFKGRPLEYYVHAVKSGRIRVNGKRVEPSYVVRDAERMSHFVHRHEPPVMAEPVKILVEDPNVITVCKPPSIPVHPCGQYRKNTVVGILEAEHKTGQLFRNVLLSAIHRLDRLVSGLLILARNSQTADLFRQEIEAGRVHKQYVAKVRGVFPAHEVEVNAAVIYDAKEGVSSIEAGNPGAGKSKEACTRFQRLSTDGLSSIVRCEPVTGRTHQIRVHLQHLGHPIANDNLYLQVNPPKRSKQGISADTVAKAARILPSREPCAGNLETCDDASRDTGEGMLKSVCISLNSGELEVDISHNPVTTHGSTEATTHGHSNQDASLNGCHRDSNANEGFEPTNCAYGFSEPLKREPDCVHPVTNISEVEVDQIEGQGQHLLVDKMCTHCPNLGPAGYKNDEDGLWLHCVRYASQSWEYMCPLPEWAL